MTLSILMTLLGSILMKLVVNGIIAFYFVTGAIRLFSSSVIFLTP